MSDTIPPDASEDGVPTNSLFLVYPATRKRMFESGFNAPLYIALLKGTYSFNTGHETWGDVAPHEVVGPGYSSGGQAVPYIAFYSTISRRDYVVRLTADPQWPASLFSLKYAVAYQESPLGSNRSGWPLLGYADLNRGGGELNIRTGTLRLLWANRNLIRIR